MHIAVIADTHDNLPEHILADLSSADEIWHLGDVMRPETLDAIHALKKPLIVVRGNNDFHREWPLCVTLERAGKKFLLIHIPPYRVMDGPDFLLHGHTHVPRDEMAGHTRVLNPGTIGKPNKGAPPSYAWLDIDETSGAVDWKIVPV